MLKLDVGSNVGKTDEIVLLMLAILPPKVLSTEDNSVITDVIVIVKTFMLLVFCCILPPSKELTAGKRYEFQVLKLIRLGTVLFILAMLVIVLGSVYASKGVKAFVLLSISFDNRDSCYTCFCC